MSDVQLGFGPSPRAVFVYLSTDKSPETGWYTWNFAQEKADPIGEPALTGYVQGVEVATKEFQGKENKKLRVEVSAGPRNYVIETGFYTAFSKSLLMSLARLRPAHFDVPLAIETTLGDKKAVFANVYNAENGNKVNYDADSWPNDETVDALFAQIQQTFATRVAQAKAAAQAGPALAATGTDG